MLSGRASRTQSHQVFNDLLQPGKIGVDLASTITTAMVRLSSISGLVFLADRRNRHFREHSRWICHAMQHQMNLNRAQWDTTLGWHPLNFPKSTQQCDMLARSTQLPSGRHEKLLPFQKSSAQGSKTDHEPSPINPCGFRSH